jgi:hypothetical protein
MSATPNPYRTRRFGVAVTFAFIAATSTGCAGRAAPFDKLDKAQVTILKLQAPPQATAMPTPAGGAPLIPGIPPELQGLAEQTLQQLQQQGLIPPGLIPGMPGAMPGQPIAPQMPVYPNDPQWVIADQRPVVDDKLRDELLDIFGDKGAFNDQRGQCWFPGMAVSFQSPTQPQPVDVVISLSCNQAVGYGFQWPHPESGLTQDTHGKLSGIYQSMFGPVPPGA